MKRQWYKLLAVSSFGILCFANLSCKEENQNTTVKTTTISFKKEGELQIKKTASDSLIARLDIEIADDNYSTQTGLMYRKSMENKQAMLFIFPDSEYRNFYMNFSYS